MDAKKPRGPVVVDVSFPEIEKFDRLPEPSVDGPSAFVSVMEGCSKYCTFCVVPYTRGEEVSRPFDDVLVEVAQLAAKGVREINLLGQNVNGYRGLNHLGEVIDFAELIRGTGVETTKAQFIAGKAKRLIRRRCSAAGSSAGAATTDVKELKAILGPYPELHGPFVVGLEAGFERL